MMMGGFFKTMILQWFLIQVIRATESIAGPTGPSRGMVQANTRATDEPSK
jgi:hypothetical protein